MLLEQGGFKISTFKQGAQEVNEQFGVTRDGKEMD